MGIHWTGIELKLYCILLTYNDAIEELSLKSQASFISRQYSDSDLEM